MRAVPEVVEIDPREYLPWLDASWEEAVRAWCQDRACLCGCGTPMTQRIRAGTSLSGARIPAGSFYFFARGHSRRVPIWREQTARVSIGHTPERMARRRAGRYPAALIVASVRDWIEEGHRNAANIPRNWMALANHISLSKQIMYSIKNGHRPYVDPSTAARILQAIGEPLRPELREALRKYEERRESAQEAA